MDFLWWYQKSAYLCNRFRLKTGDKRKRKSSLKDLHKTEK